MEDVQTRIETHRQAIKWHKHQIKKLQGTEEAREFEYSMPLIIEKDKAVLVKWKGSDSEGAWLPKSQLEFDVRGETLHFDAPDWIVKSKNKGDVVDLEDYDVS